MILLQTLGAIFLLILMVGAYFGWKIYRRVKRAQGEFSDISLASSVLPARHIELEPSSREAWQEQDRLAHKENQLKRIGASHVGYFCSYSGYAIIRISLWDYKNQLVAAIYEGATEQNPNDVAFIFEVACKLNEGSICITSNAHALNDHRPPQHLMFFNESESITDFIKAVKPNIPADKKLQKIVDAKAFFIDCFKETAEWAWREPQLRSSKTQQTFAAVGVTVTDELLDELVSLGQDFTVEVAADKVKSKLASNPKMTASQWESMREQLVVVNEHMSQDHIITAIYDLAGELTELQEQVLEGFELSNKNLDDPIAAFQLLLQSMNIKAKRIAKTETPVKSEVYLRL